MATSAGEIEVKLSLKTGDFNKLMGQSQDQVKTFGQKTGEFMAGSAAAITAALATIIAFGKKSVDAYIEQEQASARLVSALQNQGRASAETVGHLEDMAGALMQLTGVGDEVINTAQATLVTFGLQGEALDRTTKAALDMSAAMGIDLEQAATLLGKAFQGNTGTLARYGIEVNKTGDSSKKFADALGQVENRFGGSAQAQAATFGGQLKILSANFGELLEVVGKLIAGEGGGIVGWLTSMIQKITESLNVIANLRAQFGSLGDFLKTFTVSILGTLVLTFLTLVQKMYELGAAIPIVGKMYQHFADNVKISKQWVEDQIVALQTSKIIAAQAAGVMVAAEKEKQAEFKNTATQFRAITDQQSLYVKDKMAEEIKLRGEHAEALQKAQADFAESFMTTQAEMWGFAKSMTESFTNGVGQGFAKMVMEGKNFGDSMKQMFRDMAAEIIAWLIKMIVKMLIFIALKEAAKSFGPVGVAISGAMSTAASSGLTGMATGGTIAEPSILTGLRSGRQHLVGESGPEAVVPMNIANSEMGGGGGGGGITINISGQFIEGDENSWQRLLRDKIVPEIRRFTMTTPVGPFTRRRGVA